MSAPTKYEDTLDVLDRLVEQRRAMLALPKETKVDEYDLGVFAGILHYYSLKGHSGMWFDASVVRAAVAGILDVSENKAAQLIRELAKEGKIAKKGDSTATQYTSLAQLEAEEQARRDEDARLRAIAARLEAARVPYEIYDTVNHYGGRKTALQDVRPGALIWKLKVRVTPEEILAMLEG